MGRLDNMRVSGPDKRTREGKQRPPPISFYLGSDEDLQIMSMVKGSVNVSHGPNCPDSELLAQLLSSPTHGSHELLVTSAGRDHSMYCSSGETG